MKPPEPRTPTRWKAVCAYDGTHYHGWQSQTNAVAVQDVIEGALEKILGVATRIHGSGRTDTGVHARGQVFHFDAVWPHGPGRLVTALGTKLPASVQVRSVVAAAADFHARFHATGKRYIYHLHLGAADPFETAFCWSVLKPVDLDRLEAGARLLRGRHDFAAFCAVSGDERETTVRDLRRLEVVGRGRRVRVILEADGFLYKMARSLVGTLVNIGMGHLAPEDAAALLHTGGRIPKVKTAPAHGLFLDRVFYD